MDTLKGLIYLETANEKGIWYLAVDSTRTRVFKGRERRRLEFTKSNKRSGVWKFKAFRFNGGAEVVERPITKIIPIVPESSFSQFPISELRKLKGWKDVGGTCSE